MYVIVDFDNLQKFNYLVPLYLWVMPNFANTQLPHQDLKRLREAIMKRNTEEINYCISGNVTILNSVLEASL